MPPSWWSLKRDQKTVKQVAFDIFMNVRQVRISLSAFGSYFAENPLSILDDSNKFKFP